MIEAWGNSFPAISQWHTVAKRARELLAFSQKAEPVPAIDWKARAEKAEARLENLRAFGERAMRTESVWGYAGGAMPRALAEAGFAVQPEIPAQPLRVVEAGE